MHNYVIGLNDHNGTFWIVDPILVPCSSQQSCYESNIDKQ